VTGPLDGMAEHLAHHPGLASWDGGSFPELVPLRPGERAILGPVPCRGCGAPLAFTLPDPPLSFLGSWRSARARNNLGQLVVATFAHDCPGARP
jgi:hypothetical protein